MQLNQYLDDANLLEVVTDFLNCDILSKSLYKNGVVVRVVLLSSCEGDQRDKGQQQSPDHSDEYVNHFALSLTWFIPWAVVSSACKTEERVEENTWVKNCKHLTVLFKTINFILSTHYKNIKPSSLLHLSDGCSYRCSTYQHLVTRT